MIVSVLTIPRYVPGLRVGRVFDITGGESGCGCTQWNEIVGPDD